METALVITAVDRTHPREEGTISISPPLLAGLHLELGAEVEVLNETTRVRFCLSVRGLIAEGIRLNGSAAFFGDCGDVLLISAARENFPVTQFTD